MKKIKAIKGQSLFDIALQHCGDAGEAHAIALANDLPDDYVALGGENLMIPNKNKSIVNRLAKEKVIPCTGDDGMKEGIGYDVIGIAMIG